MFVQLLPGCGGVTGLHRQGYSNRIVALLPDVISVFWVTVIRIAIVLPVILLATGEAEVLVLYTYFHSCLPLFQVGNHLPPASTLPWLRTTPR